jgi:uncharacterized protein (TIGR02246 family)
MYFVQSKKENMKINFLLVVVMSILGAVQAQSNATETIKNLNAGWLNAIQNKDSVALGKILADDFIMITPSGSTLTKRDNLQYAVSKEINYKSINIDSVKVRLLNNEVAVLSCWTSFTFSTKGKDMTGHNCYQDIYMKRRDEWLAVSAHVTLLSMK